jgi:hypothetical protein
MSQNPPKTAELHLRLARAEAEMASCATLCRDDRLSLNDRCGASKGYLDWMLERELILEEMSNGTPNK